MEYQTTHQGVRDLDHPLPRYPVNVGRDERAASTLGGAALAGYALGTGCSWGILLGALAGAALAYRGISGHCDAYAALGVNTALR